MPEVPIVFKSNRDKKLLLLGTGVKRQKEISNLGKHS